MRKIQPIALLLCICLALATARPTFAKAKAPPAQASNDPVVMIKPPASYYTKKIAFFPLEIPVYLLKGITWPLGAASRYVERKGLIERVSNGLSNKKHTLWIYPIIEGGAGSGFGGGAGVRAGDLFHQNYQLSARYTVHINFDQHASFSFWRPGEFDIAGVPAEWHFDTRWQRLTGNDFFGIGNWSSANNHTQYLLNEMNITGGLITIGRN